MIVVLLLIGGAAVAVLVVRGRHKGAGTPVTISAPPTMRLRLRSARRETL